MLICTPGPGIGQLRCLQLGHLRGEDRRRRRAQRGRRRRQEPQRGGQVGRRGQVLLASPNALLREFNRYERSPSKILRAGKRLPIIKSKPLPCQRHIIYWAAVQLLAQQTLEPPPPDRIRMVEHPSLTPHVMKYSVHTIFKSLVPDPIPSGVQQCLCKYILIKIKNF